RFAAIHERHFSMNIHRSSHFLPWHREFLLRFEAELKKIDPGVDLPYWDSSVDQSTTGPLWDQAFLGQFDGLWKLNRALGSASLPTPQQVSNNQQTGNYGVFWDLLGLCIHNPPHPWGAGV